MTWSTETIERITRDFYQAGLIRNHVVAAAEWSISPELFEAALGKPTWAENEMRVMSSAIKRGLNLPEVISARCMNHEAIRPDVRSDRRVRFLSRFGQHGWPNHRPGIAPISEMAGLGVDLRDFGWARRQGCVNQKLIEAQAAGVGLLDYAVLRCRIERTPSGQTWPVRGRAVYDHPEIVRHAADPEWIAINVRARLRAAWTELGWTELGRDGVLEADPDAEPAQPGSLDAVVLLAGSGIAPAAAWKAAA